MVVSAIGGGNQNTWRKPSTSDHEKHRKVRQHWRQKRKKACAYIKRVKTDSYLTYDHNVKHEIIRGGQFYWWRKPEYSEKTTDLFASH